VRAERFARSVQEELGSLLARVKDPRVSGVGLLTVTRVEVTDDLSIARVEVALHGASEQAQKDLIKGLTSARPFLQRELGRALRAKKVPELRFQLEDFEKKGGRVEELLREIAAEKKA
jgi:ribosome-binding factor A